MGHRVTLCLSHGVTGLVITSVNVCLVNIQTLNNRGLTVKVTRETKQYKFRIPDEMLAHLKEQAEKNFRSLNAELLARVAKTMGEDMNDCEVNSDKI